MDRPQSDVVVVGAGAAGLYATLCATRRGARVTVISATPLAQTASYWAQGGIAAALAAEDSPDLHLEDTVKAGREAVRVSAAGVLCSEAPEIVHDLQGLGVRFDADRRGRLSLGLEGGHSIRRVVHAGGSATGRRVTRALAGILVEQTRAEVLEGRRAAALLMDDGRCLGVVCEDGHEIRARATILSTGGAAALWSRTTNPPGAFGSGLLLAHHAGAALADLELVQFHPTAVVHPGRNGFLVTEAIRGEGATLHRPDDGERFVDELLPRDEVARRTDEVLRETGATAVDLDMRMVDPTHFPNVVRALRGAGIDPAAELIPVAPAAHYVMGGVVTDLAGRSTVPGLFAVGETSCTGLHGANRLASNSLSECFVFGRRAALAALDEPVTSANGRPRPAGDPPPAPTWETRNAMWAGAGLLRSAETLTPLLEDPHPLARLVAAGALAREESRGAHQRTDFPGRNPALDDRHTVQRPDRDPAFERWL